MFAKQLQECLQTLLPQTGPARHVSLLTRTQMLSKRCCVLIPFNRARTHHLDNQVVQYLVHITLSQHVVVNKRLQLLHEPVWSAPVFAPAPRPQGSPSTHPWLILSQVLDCYHQPHWKQQLHDAASCERACMLHISTTGCGATRLGQRLSHLLLGPIPSLVRVFL